MHSLPTGFKLVECGLRKIIVRVSRVAFANSGIIDIFGFGFCRKKEQTADFFITQGEFGDFIFNDVFERLKVTFLTLYNYVECGLVIFTFLYAYFTK